MVPIAPVVAITTQVKKLSAACGASGEAMRHRPTNQRDPAGDRQGDMPPPGPEIVCANDSKARNEKNCAVEINNRGYLIRKDVHVDSLSNANCHHGWADQTCDLS